MVASPEDHPAGRTREAEQAVLGSMMRDPAHAWPAVEDVLEEAHFIGADHQLIFAAMVKLHKEGMPPDAFTVSNQLAHELQLEAAGGTEYIANLYADTPSAANIRAYVKLVREAADKRKIVDFAKRLSEKAANGSAAADLGTDAAAEFERLRKNIGVERRPRRFMRWDELEGHEPPARAWTISHWLTSGGTLFAGRGSVGKSLLAQTLGTAIALGIPFVDEISAPRNVLMWMCEEEHDEIWRRQAAICRFFGVPLSAVKGKFFIEERLGEENTLLDLVYGAPAWTPLRRELAEQIHDVDAKVFFLDNLSHTFGGKENERHHATTFVNGIAGLSQGLAAVIMAHPAKAEESEFSGSSGWENAVRMRWYMSHRLPDEKAPEPDEEEDANVRYLIKRKVNYSVKDYRKFSYRDGLFAPEVSLSPLGGVMKQAAEECVLYALKLLGDKGIRTTDSRNSPDYLPRKMREMNITSENTQGDLATALSRLRLSGRIIEGEVGKYGNRAPKIGLILA